ncbi:MAG TPA: DUF2249 domain-containing protein [Ktedonobacterales bacterium]|jgi:uncharacterized protein (DUF2249 family)
MTLILDIRDLPVDARLACVLARFGALGHGDILRLVTDRDPQRMRVPLVGDERWRASWSPEQQGPETWMIRIEKLSRSAV